MKTRDYGVKMDREKEVLLVLTALTVLHAIENLWFVPWSPLMVIFAILAILIPLKLRKREELGLKRPQRWRDFLRYTALGFIIGLAIHIVVLTVYPVALESLGLRGNIQYDYWAANDSWFEHMIQKFGEEVWFIWLVLFTTVWAPIGEELLYRGYAFSTLLEKRSFVTASTISSLCFGVRHTLHLTLSMPTIPVIAGLSYGIITIPLAYIWCYVFHKTKSLYSTMLLHLLVNLTSGILFAIQALPK